VKIAFTTRFSKDLSKIKQLAVREAVGGLIDTVKSAQSLSDIPHLKKLQGADDAYRLRVGDYRIGCWYREHTLIFARIADRKDLYRMFP
jgi:mRNA interferase RelE/StbE